MDLRAPPFALLSLLSFVAFGLPARGQDPALEEELAFESPHEDGAPHGWGGGPPSTIHLDGGVTHGGEWAVRLERDGSSPSGFTALTRVVPANVEGHRIVLKGWLRSEEVGARGALWIRLDGSAGMLAIDNMNGRGVVGTTDWQEYRVELPLQAKAEQVYFGALLSGSGRLWVDDLELLVDDRPYSEAPKVEREPTVLDTDTEFDAGSRVVLGRLDDRRVESLVVLGKVWGFLKYHHPRIANGEHHWDYELFRVLPTVLEAEDVAARNEVLVEWVASLGEPGPCSPCAEAPPGESVHFWSDLDWIRDREVLGDDLVEALVDVHENRFAGPQQFYVGFQPNVGNPMFEHELAYGDLGEPDAGFRLLALFRFWNIIEHWFPYRDVIGEDWDGVLREMVTRFAEAEGRDDYRLALLELIARVHDTHANLWGALDVQPPRGECRAPFFVRFVQERAVVAGDARVEREAALGVQVGDAIVEVDGRLVDDLVAEWEPRYPASNRPTRLRDIGRNLTRGACGAFDLAVERDGRLVEVSAERVPLGELDPLAGRLHDRPGDTFQRLSDDIAYLKLSSVEIADIEGYVERAADTRGLVVDIRNYPSQFVVFQLGRRLIEESTPFARFTGGRSANPGTFVWGPELSLEPLAPVYEGKVVILVDEVSQSQAEYTTMALRAGRDAVVVGSTTAGADGNVSPIPLPGGVRSLISGIGVFYPDRTPTQRVGIVPDIVATPTVEGIREGRDEVLERALRVILPEATEAELRRLAMPPEG